jgi:formate dehydrogenase iron-sulfur subunit
VMTEGSLCAMGGLTPMPVRSAITHFADDFLAGQPSEVTRSAQSSARTDGMA